MKTDNTTTLKYVPYGVNGVYFVYDGRYTSGKEGTKKQIQAECDRLNKELAINNYRKGNCNDEPHFTTPDDEIIDTITTLTERTKEESLEYAADSHVKNVMGEFYGIDKEEMIALISIFKAGANWQYDKLKAINDSLLNALKDAIGRMDKCRNILQTTSSESKGNWGILDTEKSKEAIKKAEQ